MELAAPGTVPSLRKLRLNRSATADLGPLRALPVVTLADGASEATLEALASHPTLRALALGRDGEGPVRVAPLRTMSRLYGFDLSATPHVPGLDVLQGMSDLGYLALRPDQRDGTPPSSRSSSGQGARCGHRRRAVGQQTPPARGAEPAAARRSEPRPSPEAGGLETIATVQSRRHRS
ncbi:hypothetical protein E1281_36715 [Actinomadura sp. KC345]|uniref:hypothetical protein n=1 Tax=Actinomadura sp. KC345 TaxID=2530371 RepID=UPI001048D0A7|nr:hypothetical protein [Actinomadura sp. KC345]TDC42002.1 hypothetical protein E1281_36715 [Actinomadura sp. KC345]